VLIDPGHAQFIDHVKRGLSDLNLSTSDMGMVLLTHAHPDHIEAVPFFKNESTLIAVHEAEWLLAKSMEPYLQSALGLNLDAFSPDIFLREGNFSFNGMMFEIFHTPGHSPGSVSLYWPEKKALFTGDLIFRDGLGRTDLPGGDGAQLKESIKRLSGLDAEYLLSGHGDVIIGKEKVKENFDRVEQAWFHYI
jgi:glyoxylase-like metal-dependent hydrolase (beta-lactamase superfamily II)